MNELSLFTGAGGGILGTHLLGWRPIGYVEVEDYCQRILAQRIKDGILPEAPIFGDIRAFIGEGYAASYQGMVDVITAGFPCQPFSVAGKRQGGNDLRNLWPETIECIRIVRPAFALLENVPGLLSSGYFGQILGDMAESGYDAQWRVLSAAEVGAPHKRDRLWIVAYDTKQRNRSISIFSEEEWQSCSGIDTDRSCAALADTESPKRKKSVFSRPKRLRNGLAGNGEDVSNADSQQCKEQCGAESVQPEFFGSGCCWWLSEPRLGRVAHGVAHRVDRLKAIGNGQVPRVVATAWRLLNE